MTEEEKKRIRDYINKHQDDSAESIAAALGYSVEETKSLIVDWACGLL